MLWMLSKDVHHSASSFRRTFITAIQAFERRSRNQVNWVKDDYRGPRSLESMSTVRDSLMDITSIITFLTFSFQKLQQPKIICFLITTSTK